MVLKKPAENVIKREVDRYLKENPRTCCSCEQCRDDIVALALQNLPDKYSTTERGEVFLSVEFETPPLKVDMLKAIIQAVERVRKNPRHPISGEKRE